MCDYRISSVDTGKRREIGPGRTDKRVVWEHSWTATCGATGGPFEVKGQCVADAINHTRGCTK